MKFNTPTIRFKIFLVMTAIFTVFLLFELLLFYPNMLKRSMEGAHRELRGVSYGLARGTDSIFNRSKAELAAASGLPGLHSGSRKDRENILNILSSVSQYYNYFYLADAEGTCISNPWNKDQEGHPPHPEDLPFLKKAFDSNEVVFIPPRQDPSGYLVTGFAAPVSDDYGNPESLLCGIVILNEFKSNSIVVNNSRIGQTGYVYMTAGNGWLIAHPQEQIDYGNYSPIDYSGYVPVQKALKGESGLVVYDYKGESWTAWYSPVPVTGWSIVAQRPTKDIRSTAFRATYNTILVFTIVYLLSGIIIFLLIGISLKPLKLLIRSVSLGQPIPALAKNRDEIGNLAVLFGKLYSDLKTAKDKAEENDRLKTAFLANISHEIRTPMNGILGFTELLKDPGTREYERVHFLEIIHNSGLRMLNIINDIIDISRIEAGQIPLHLHETDIAPILIHLHSAFFPEADHKNIDLLMTGCPGTGEQILRTDETKLSQILTNLVKNAIKYTESGSIEIRYERSAEDHLFKIIDTGPGIPDELRDSIFERFHQGDHTGRYSSDGVGLGLAISKAYAESLGGTLSVESRKNGGSTFILILPA